MKRELYVPLMMTALIALFFGLNLFAGSALRGVRLDLTEQGLYRLSPGARDVMQELEEPLEWRFMYSRRASAEYPAIRAYADRVREMLRAFADQSGGRILLTEIDPGPFSAEEDIARAAGLTATPTAGGDDLYFGLIARNAIDETRTIPLFSEGREARLEYDLARLIAELDRDTQPRLAILTGLPIGPDSGAPDRIPAELAAAYELVWVDRDFEQLPEAEALLLLHPPEMQDTQLYAIDQFALRQGRLIVMVDPLSFLALRRDADGLPAPGARRESDLSLLLTHWGVDYDPRSIVIDRGLALEINQNQDGRLRRVRYPPYFSPGPEEMNRDDLATQSLLRGVFLLASGALEPLPGGALAFEPLVSTSPEGRRIDVDQIAVNPAADDLLRDYGDPDGSLVVMARLSGVADTAFPDGPPAGEALFNPSDHLRSAPGPVDIVIGADTDWMADDYYVRRTSGREIRYDADNLFLALNLVDVAIGDRALIGLRSRTPSARLMTRVIALREAAEETYRDAQDNLLAELAEAETRLQELEAAGGASALAGASTQDRQDAILLRQEIESGRARLREIEASFRAEIDALDAGLQFWTISVPPALIILAGVAGALVRRRRRA